MGEGEGKRKRNRIRCKIDDLPQAQKDMVRLMLMDTANTYLEISEYLRNEGYDISKSAVGRYALRQNAVAQRLSEVQEQTRLLVNAVKDDPDVDYTEASMRMLITSLTEKIATAQEEFDQMDLAEAGRLIVSLSRTKVYKERVRADIEKRAKVALEAFKTEIKAELSGHEPELMQRLIEVADRVADRMMEG